MGDVQSREEIIVANGVNDDGFPSGHLKHKTFKDRLQSVGTG